MKKFIVVLAVVVFLGCTGDGVFSRPNDDDERYSAAVISLSDFSMSIMGYYQRRGLSIPGDFNAAQFFTLLEQIYDDQERVRSVRDGYKVSVRRLDGGYSVMLCDLQTDRKVMEDFSCHLNRVELLSWKSDAAMPCVFEVSWEQLCK